MSLESNFVPYQIAFDMKSIGFDEPCIAFYFLNREEQSEYESKYKLNKEELIYAEEGGFWYNSNSEEDRISAPLYQQAFSFFREKYGLYSWINMELGATTTFCWAITGENKGTEYKAFFKTHKEAELECLKKLIEIVKEKGL